MSQEAEAREGSTVAFSVDAAIEYPAFSSWWARTIPAEPVPSSASHHFDAWMASARYRCGRAPTDGGVEQVVAAVIGSNADMCRSASAAYQACCAAAHAASLQAGEAAPVVDFLAQLRRVNTERYHAWVGDGQDAGILFDAAELGGEVGELLNVVKKLEREERGWRGSRAAPEDFADECADVLICLDKLARRRGVDLAEATVRKFNATSDTVGLPHRLALSATPARAHRRWRSGMTKQASIPSAQYKAMRRICDPMMEAASAMTGEEIALAMKGLYATSETNCPWYAFALRWALPPMLATIGSHKDGYDAAWMPDSDGTPKGIAQDDPEPTTDEKGERA